MRFPSKEVGEGVKTVSVKMGSIPIGLIQKYYF